MPLMNKTHLRPNNCIYYAGAKVLMFSVHLELGIWEEAFIDEVVGQGKL